MSLKIRTQKTMDLYELDKTLETSNEDIANLFCTEETRKRIKDKILKYKTLLGKSNKQEYEKGYKVEIEKK